MSSSRFFWGATLIVVGVVFILLKTHYIDYPARFVFRNLLPLALIILGIILIVHRARRHAPHHESGETVSAGAYQIHRSINKVFGDISIDTANIDLDGLRLSTVFGDTRANLRGGRLKSGNNNADFSTTFGDITVIAPRDTQIFAYGANTFGDLFILGKTAGGISNSLTTKTEGFDAASARLFITARTIFGDVKIYQA